MLSHGGNSDSWCEPSLIGAIWSIEALEHDFEHLSSVLIDQSIHRLARPVAAVSTERRLVRSSLPLKPNAGSQSVPQRFPRRCVLAKCQDNDGWCLLQS